MLQDKIKGVYIGSKQEEKRVKFKRRNWKKNTIC